MNDNILNVITLMILLSDSGLVVPCIDYDLRNKLFDIAEACGFSMERRLEMIGRSSSEMVLQLLGGSSRSVYDFCLSLLQSIEKASTDIYDSITHNVVFL